MNKISTIAFTGHSGAGKSIAARYLESKGIPNIDCDELARKVVETGSECLQKLTEVFTTDILKCDGTLDRKKLAKKAFSSPENKQELDKITHPYILLEQKKELELLQKNNNTLCIIEAPALIESGLYKDVDKIILIASSEEKLIERVVQRDSLSNKEIKQRLELQIDEEILKEYSDYVICNDGTVDEFKEKLDKLYIELIEWSSIQ